MDATIQREKLEQASGILDERDIDCWLTFARETSETPDPALKLIVGHDVTWQSAFIVTRTGAAHRHRGRAGWLAGAADRAI